MAEVGYLQGRLLRGAGFLGPPLPKILLIQLGDIGDVVLTMPCIRALREAFPRAHITVAVREKAKELVEDCPWSSAVLAIDKKRRPPLALLQHQTHFVKRVWRARFDLAIDLRTGTRGAILTLLTGAPRRVSFYAPDGGLWRNRIFTHLYHAPYHPSLHVAHYYLSLVQSIGIPTPHPQPLLHIPPQREEELARLFQREGIPPGVPLVTLHPFSLWRYKEWTVQGFRELMAGILAMHPEVFLMLMGTPHERSRAVSLAQGLGPRVRNLAGKTPLGLLPALVRASRLFIGVDSLGIHIAGAVGTPSVALFGPSAPSSWAPQGEGHLVVQKELPCVPCRRKGCQDSEVSRCLEELTPQEVLVAVEQQLARWEES